MPAPVITPGGPLTKRGKDVQAFTATNGVDEWTCSAGTLSNNDVDSADWTAPNKTGTFTVTATNGDGFDTVTITVTAVVPFPPDWDFEGEEGNNVIPFTPDKGPRQGVVLGDQSTFNFIRNTGKKSEHDEMKQFHADHDCPGILFYFTVPGETELLWEIDSKFKRRGRRTNLWSYSFTLLRRT